MARQTFGIMAENIDLANSVDNVFSDITLSSTGLKGEHDVIVDETDFIFTNGDVTLQTGALKTGKIEDLNGVSYMSLGSDTIDFHGKTASNLNLGVGSIGAATVGSANGYSSLDAELDTIHTTKLSTSGHTANRLMITSNGGIIQASGISSTLPTTNQTNIGTIGNLATSASDLVSAINEIHTEGNTNASSISTLDGDVVKKATSQTITGDKVFTGNTQIESGKLFLENSGVLTTFQHSNSGTTTLTMPASSGTLALDTNLMKTNNSSTETITGDKFFSTGQLTATTGRFHLYDNTTTKIATLQYSSNTHEVITLPGSTGTLALTSDIPTNNNQLSNGANYGTAANITANTNAINTKLALTGGTLTGDLQGTRLGLGAAPSHNLTITDNSETFVVNHNTAYTTDAYYVGTTTDTPVRIGANNNEGVNIAPNGKVGLTRYNSTTDYNVDIGGNVRFVSNSGSSHKIVIDRGDAYWSVINSSHEWDAFQDSANKYTQAASTTGFHLFFNYYSDGNVDVCNGGGTLRHTGISNVSDDRLKHNEVDISGAVNLLKQLKPQKYYKSQKPYEADHNFQLDGSNNYVDSSGNIVKGKTEAGFIAQDMLNTDLAWLVGGGGTMKKSDLSGNIVEVEDMYNVNYDGLHAYTIKAIQEQQEMIENQRVLLEQQAKAQQDLEELCALQEEQLEQERVKTAYFEMRINQILSHLNI